MILKAWVNMIVVFWQDYDYHLNGIFMNVFSFLHHEKIVGVPSSSQLSKFFVYQPKLFSTHLMLFLLWQVVSHFSTSPVESLFHSLSAWSCWILFCQSRTASDKLQKFIAIHLDHFCLFLLRILLESITSFL